MNNSKAAITVSNIISKIQMICGVICVFFGIMGISASIGHMTTTDIVFILIFLVGGYLLIRNSRRRKKLIEAFKNYVAYLSSEPTGSIENLAMAMGTSQDEVKENVNLMISKKYFTNAYIDLKENMIVISGSQSAATTSQSYVGKKDSDTEYVSITCPSCGGVNKVEKGTVHECDFCGSHING